MRIPRFLSSVTGLAASGSSAGPTQTFNTPSTGARKLNFDPSGLSLAAALSGFPNSTLRGINSVAGGGVFDPAAAGGIDSARSCPPVDSFSDAGLSSTVDSSCADGDSLQPERDSAPIRQTTPHSAIHLATILL
ncbi:MAG: hypothetical protein A2V70_20155 [Planctomycetes bacterium RBG_13_63_9]|nr:MAG: hypothetical protein A2V70_20155 [Planctomycetes bacterium RBG_13_63_9]